MQTLKKELYSLIDNLPNEEIHTAEKFLQFLISDYKKFKEQLFIDKIVQSPIDDEPLTKEDMEAIKESEEAITKGCVQDWRDVEKAIT
jgi:hypothetical protein